ncbi:hypothetical protein, partial [Acinetobacter baumannii]
LEDEIQRFEEIIEEKQLKHHSAS